MVLSADVRLEGRMHMHVLLQAGLDTKCLVTDRTDERTRAMSRVAIRHRSRAAKKFWHLFSGGMESRGVASLDRY
ncbi:unnamed protein product [Protopolystoma xenopodis]|uniref:Uncharacterized protein n=1 Tax=Protopolystoma xenopodis TaxID=117903 RepID=A0A448XH26_9PLAT|nr:unnamed protein product [Protopolystoma xenopodis]